MKNGRIDNYGKHLSFVELNRMQQRDLGKTERKFWLRRLLQVLKLIARML